MGFRLVYLFLLILVLSLSAGCGFLGFGGDSDGDGLDTLIEFQDELPPDEGAGIAAVRRPLYIPPEVLLEVQFLYNLQVRMEGLRQTIRDLSSAADYSGPPDVDLDWVVEAHEVTREADAFFSILAGLDVPESQRAQYEYLYINMLEIVQVTSYGSDRLLAASVLVGPSGRSLVNMTSEEVDRFEVLIREASFFLSDADSRAQSGTREIGRAVGSIRLR